MKLTLPQAEGSLLSYSLRNPSPRFADVIAKPLTRTVYAAAHVVADAAKQRDPWDEPPVIDWDRTLAFREYLWRLGFKVAEAMDTSQRGMGLDWSTAKTLITRSLAHARSVPGADLACGVGTDQLAPEAARGMDDVLAAYSEQIEAVEAAGGRIILMASRALAKVARSRDDYLSVYFRLLAQCRGKVILHWLGEMFDPALAGYWGTDDPLQALDTVSELIREHHHKIDGIKMSLLDASLERQLRQRMPADVLVFTGDDYNYPELLAGDGTHHSHALLGIFAAIAPIAAHALQALANNDAATFRHELDPTVALSREIFRSPTRYYKAGIVFLAWLNGHQPHFNMVGGMQSARGITHYARVFELADQCGALLDPERATAKMRHFLSSHGVE